MISMTYILRNWQCPVSVPSGFWARKRETTAFAFRQEGLGARQKASHGLDSSVGGLTG